MSKQCSGCENEERCKELRNFDTLKREFTAQLGGRDTKLVENLNAEKMVLYSCVLGEYLADRSIGLKTAQVRRFLDAFRRKNSVVQQDKSNAREESFLLEPRLAYAAGRQPREVGPLFEMMKPVIERVRKPEDFDRLTRFLESVVAYHRFHGGREQ